MPLRILVCPDKFRGSLTAREASEAIVRGIRRALPTAEIDQQPLADGGEGSLDLVREGSGLKSRRVTISGPLRRSLRAEYLLGSGRAIIETARACGLHLVPPPRRHPKNTTTVGVGMLIEDALARGARDITLFLGGSATNDCGAGMAAALGFRFYGDKGQDFIPMADSLGYVERIDTSGRLAVLDEARFTAVHDVNNPLLGPEGATYTYAEQKGAAPTDLPILEENMDRFANLIAKELGHRVAQQAGSGAAGGLGAGAIAFLGADLHPGSEVIPALLDVPQRANRADLIITGEGKIDRQTVRGKVVAGVVGYGQPTVAVCGVSELTAGELGVDAVLSITDRAAGDRTSAFQDAAHHLEELVADYLIANYSAT